MEKGFKLISENRRHDFVDTRLVIHEKIAAGKHNAESRADQRNEQRICADEKSLHIEPRLFAQTFQAK